MEDDAGNVVHGCGEGNLGGGPGSLDQGHIRASSLGAGQGGDNIRGSVSNPQSGSPPPWLPVGVI